MFPSVWIRSAGDQITANFGQRPFVYSAPAGYKALCTTNLPIPTIGSGLTSLATKYFNPVTYTGNGTNDRAVTGVGFQPDLVWVKERSGVTNHVLNDVIRGGSRGLFSNNTEAEYYDPDSFVKTFTSDGFTVGSTGGVNANGATYVGWNWKAGGTAVTNTSGSLTSQVSANRDAGFSIVTYTGTGANATVGHGLGVAPSVVIVKKRSSGGGVSNWCVYFSAVSNAATSYLFLNTTDAIGTGNSILWNSTAPTSISFSIGTASNTNESSATFVAYCFAPIAGYSAFGSYTGNGNADGPFVYTGFKPRFLMIKNTAAASADWVIYDSVRSTYNIMGEYLNPNLTGAAGAATVLDFLSNGFKLKIAGGGTHNQNTNVYIYMAFAEHPFKYSLAR